MDKENLWKSYRGWYDDKWWWWRWWRNTLFFNLSRMFFMTTSFVLSSPRYRDHSVSASQINDTEMRTYISQSFASLFIWVTQYYHWSSSNRSYGLHYHTSGRTHNNLFIYLLSQHLNKLSPWQHSLFLMNLPHLCRVRQHCQKSHCWRYLHCWHDETGSVT